METVIKTLAKKKELNIVNHPDFDLYAPQYINWENLIIGGNKVEGNNSPRKYGSNNYNNYLLQAAHEPDNQWEIRQWISCYRNYALPIVSVFSSAVWRKEPIRHLPDILKPFVDDVDRKGTTANVFFQNVTWWAAVHGINHILIDMPELPDDLPRTKAIDKQFDIRPYMVNVSALNVPTWKLSEGKDVLDFIVINNHSMKVISPFEEAKDFNEYTIYSKSGWEKYESTEKEVLMKTKSGLYSIGTVPVSTCYFKGFKPMVGESVIDPIASLCIHAYRMGNSLDKSLYDTAFPLMALLGFDEDEIGDFVRSSHNGLIGPADASASYIEPSGRAFSDLRTAISQDITDIQEIALRMIKPSGKQVQSALSKQEDRLQLDSQIAVFARNIENAETRCWELMLDWLEKPELKSEINIQYNRDFNLSQLSGEVLTAFAKMRETGDISRETFWRVMQQGEIPFPADFDYSEELDRIKKEQSFRYMEEKQNKVLDKDVETE